MNGRDEPGHNEPSDSIRVPDHSILPPLALHSARNFFRALPCRPLALAWSLQALEMAFFSALVCVVLVCVLAAGAAAGGSSAQAGPKPIASDNRIPATIVDFVIIWSPHHGFGRNAIYQACCANYSVGRHPHILSTGFRPVR